MMCLQAVKVQEPTNCNDVHEAVSSNICLLFWKIKIF